MNNELMNNEFMNNDFIEEINLGEFDDFVVELVARLTLKFSVSLFSITYSKAFLFSFRYRKLGPLIHIESEFKY